MSDWGIHELDPDRPCPTEIRAALRALGERSYPEAPTYHVIARDPAAAPGTRGVFAWAYRDLDAAVGRSVAENEAGRNMYVFHQRLFAGGRLWRGHRLGKRDRRGLRFPIPWGRLGNPPQAQDVDTWHTLCIDLDPAPTLDRREWPRAQAAALAVIDRLAQDVPLSFVLDSGRGVQAGYRPPNGANRFTEEWAALEQAARRLLTYLREATDESVLSVDNIANVNRFVRMPGSVNTKTGRRAQLIRGTL